MALKLQISLIICIVVFFIAIIYLLRKNALQLRYIILWMLTGFVLLIVAFFPRIMQWISGIVGIYDVTNGLFAISLFFILCILLSITSIVSKLSKQNKEMAQVNAMLEKRLRHLEGKDK